MAVYVDALAIRTPRNDEARRAGVRWRQHWCHMWADWDYQLFEMAMGIGLKPYWAHEVHALTLFDLVPTKRTQAIQRGAIEMEIDEWYQRRANGTLERQANDTSDLVTWEINSSYLFPGMHEVERVRLINAINQFHVSRRDIRL